ncbi:hypothetical protein [Nocardia nova]|jgi:hypothetical protein|uniref:hypothetical protein n=1 Tax=Nocardia nova TaxID=37330 RepID=UPI00189376CC|nr:hypothetical protein [Nocardia nova]MBF6149171.1 hypothetical protein [Nocardia nova]MDN2502404.1 hypothetical protein [Nocardia nova]
MLDIDDPDDVIAASGQVAAVKMSFADQVGATTGGWSVDERPAAPLDYRLKAVFDQVTGWFDTAATDFRGRIHATHTRTHGTVTGLKDADIDGGGHVQSESV